MPDPTLPPYSEVENEPYGGSKGKFNDDAVLDKLNDFADSAHKFGESIYKRISQSDFFSRGGGGTSKDNTTTPPVEINVGNLDPEESENKPATTDDQTAAQPQQKEDSMSVLGAGAGGGNNRHGSERGLREKASEKLSAVGKSIWGYFSSTKERVRSGSGRRSRGNSDNPQASK